MKLGWMEYESTFYFFIQLACVVWVITILLTNPLSKCTIQLHLKPTGTLELLRHLTLKEHNLT